MDFHNKKFAVMIFVINYIPKFLLRVRCASLRKLFKHKNTKRTKMSLEIITGNMFSGKTSELIRRLKRYKVMGKRISVINSMKDTRSNDHVIHTHDDVDFNCIKVNQLADTLLDENFCASEVVAIDEAQFFTRLKDFIHMCLFLKKTVIVAGLDADYKQEKFGEILDCIPMSDDVTKLSALCMRCKDGTSGPFTKRTVDTDEVELVGGPELYEAVCRHHLLD